MYTITLAEAKIICRSNPSNLITLPSALPEILYSMVTKDLQRFISKLQGSPMMANVAAVTYLSRSSYVTHDQEQVLLDKYSSTRNILKLMIPQDVCCMLARRSGNL